nr:transcriptional corepressor LEUNIG [Tanacetum cinerariifolium]
MNSINIDEYLNYEALDGKEPEVDTTSSNGFTFLEIGSIHATSVNCCDISLDGKLVAIGRQDKKGHGTNVQSICWDASGEHLVSASEDFIKVWRMDSGGKANCIRQLNVIGIRFLCGTFHPCYPSLLIIGCHETRRTLRYCKCINGFFHWHRQLVLRHVP